MKRNAIELTVPAKRVRRIFLPTSNVCLAVNCCGCARRRVPRGLTAHCGPSDQPSERTVPGVLAVGRLRSYPLAIELSLTSSRTVAYAGNRGVRYFGLRFLGDCREKFAGQPAGGGGARMTMPPRPGPWQPQGPPPVPPQGPPPGYYPQQPGWGGPPPPKRNSIIKWLLVGVGLLLVIAITVGVTVLVTIDGSGGGGPSTITSASGPPIASADDNGPVEIITSEPTCQAWMPARDAMARVQNSGWGDRDPNIARSDWTPQQRSQYEAVAKSLRETAEQAVGFAQQTPHRVVRELYEQFIAYSRAYADSITNYAPRDNAFAQTSVAASYALGSICNSIAEGSAAARSTSVSPIDAPADIQGASDPASPRPVVSTYDPTCEQLDSMHAQLVTDTADWSKQDPNVPASIWSTEQRSVAAKTARVLDSFAAELVSLTRNADNPTFQDLASTTAIYMRTFASALSTFEPADNYFFIIGTRVNNVLVGACRAVAE